MRIQLLSDLHLELTRMRQDLFEIQPTDADVVVLAGDIWTGDKGVKWAVDESERLQKPIVYVAGNHEYYRQEINSALPAMRAAAEGTNVHFLENDQVIIDGTRFLGCTLWTDYNADPERSQEEAMWVCAQSMSDHLDIKVDEFDSFRPQHALELHRTSRAWLQDELNKPFSGKTVVTTHHAPSPAAQHPRFPVSVLTGAFQSNLDEMMSHEKVAAWLFGHTHHCVDKLINGTRLASNQRGYPSEDTGLYDPVFTIDI